MWRINLMNNVLNGFLVREFLSFSDMEMLVYEMRDIVQKYAEKSFECLVKWQIERIVDEIALNQFKRPDDVSILDIAVKEVRRRILYAEKNGQHTEFNLYAGIQIMSAKLNGKPIIYIKTIFPNDIYSKHLKKIPELIPFNINEDDIKEENKKKEKYELWNILSEKYEYNVPIVSCLILYDKLSIQPESFKFRSPSERAINIAMEKIMNHLLASYGCNNEIPPNKLMEYTFQAFERIKHNEIQEMIFHEKEILLNILPVIDFDMISCL